MIRNRGQRKITQDQIERFVLALRELPPERYPRARKLQRDAAESQLATLREEARDYDEIERDLVEGIADWIGRRAQLMRELGKGHAAELQLQDVRRCEDSAILFDALATALRTGDWKEPEL